MVDKIDAGSGPILVRAESQIIRLDVELVGNIMKMETRILYKYPLVYVIYVQVGIIFFNFKHERETRVTKQKICLKVFFF